MEGGLTTEFWAVIPLSRDAAANKPMSTLNIRTLADRLCSIAATHHTHLSMFKLPLDLLCCPRSHWLHMRQTEHSNEDQTALRPPWAGWMVAKYVEAEEMSKQCAGHLLAVELSAC